MHGSVRDELESMLAAKPAAADELVNHLARCRQCATEVDAMRLQSQMMKTLRAPADVEPAGGFYARVLQRIEASARRSIWWVFVYSPIGKRLAYSTLALTLALATYVVIAESRDGHLTTRTTVQSTSFTKNHYDALVMGSADEQRAAVLANFVAHPANTPSTTAQ